jgi:sugar fermentation stimulation protein A
LLFPSPLLEGRLLKRYQRFLADVELADGTTVTAHCPNTGSMLGCKEPGSRVWLSEAANPKRKLPYTWEIVEALPEVLVGVNTALSNRLVEEAIAAGAITELRDYSRIRREVRFGAENSRVDLLLEGDGPDCYVEVKNVTAAAESSIAIFPDAVSERGAKHLRELAAMAEAGHRAVLCFCVQRRDVEEVRPADAIDPVYGRTLRDALARGMEALAYRAEVTPQGIELRHPLPVVCP